MKITVFTSNQARHLALLARLAAFAERVYGVLECNTIFPGRVADFFRKSPVMQDYFSRVMDAERRLFGLPRFTSPNVSVLPIKSGDLNLMSHEQFGEALQADHFVVFGATYIKGPLCELLVSRRAVNIHMGISPQYRGSSTNFWALYDRHPEYVGATIHLLSAGLDSGPMLFHALPAASSVDPFVLGMQAVRAAHEGLAQALQTGELMRMEPVPQDNSRELRYTRNADFTDEVAGEYLKRLASPIEIESALRQRNSRDFVRPFVS